MISQSTHILKLLSPTVKIIIIPTVRQNCNGELPHRIGGLAEKPTLTTCKSVGVCHKFLILRLVDLTLIFRYNEITALEGAKKVKLRSCHEKTSPQS